MFWTTSKHAVRVIVVGITLLPCMKTFGQAGVPVSDMATQQLIATTNSTLSQVNQTVGQSGQAVAEAVSANEKAMTNINQTMANIMTASARGQAAVTQMRQNSDLYDPTLGAKARPSCGMVAAASSIQAGDNTRMAVASKAKDVSNKHIERSKYLAAGEDLDTERGQRMAQLSKATEQSAINYGESAVTTYSTNTIPPAEGQDIQPWFIVQNNMVNMAVPNPVALEKSVDGGPLLQQQSARNAPKYIQIQRQKMVSEAISEFVSDRTATYDPSFINSLFDATEESGIPFASEDTKRILGGAVGKFDAYKILSTFRMRDTGWLLSTTGAANEVGLMRDQNLMMAQMLELIYEISVESKRTNLMLNYIYAHNIEQSGAPSKYLNNQEAK